jgi:hypothetical protein
MIPPPHKFAILSIEISARLFELKSSSYGFLVMHFFRWLSLDLAPERLNA